MASLSNLRKNCSTSAGSPRNVFGASFVPSTGMSMTERDDGMEERSLPKDGLCALLLRASIVDDIEILSAGTLNSVLGS